MVGWSICPILDFINVSIGVRMYLQDRCYPSVFIGEIKRFVWFCLLVDFILFPWGPWEGWWFARVWYWCVGLPVELGVALDLVGLVYVLGTGCSLPPFV